jgi:hypothetical protein
LKGEAKMKVQEKVKENRFKEENLNDLPLADEQADEAKGGHKGEIEVHSFSFGAENPGSFAGNR